MTREWGKRHTVTRRVSYQDTRGNFTRKCALFRTEFTVCVLLFHICRVLAESQDGQTMILVALLVQMMNPRCQRLHRELDEGMVHRNAMNAHQERPESVLRHPDPAILGALTWVWRMVAEWQFAGPRSWRNLRLPRGACRSSCNRRFLRQ